MRTPSITLERPATLSREGKSKSTRSVGETVSSGRAGARRTYVEDNKDLVELEFQTRNRLLIILRVKKSRDCVVPTSATVFFVFP